MTGDQDRRVILVRLKGNETFQRMVLDYFGSQQIILTDEQVDLLSRMPETGTIGKKAQ